MRYFMVLILVLWAGTGWAEEWSLTDTTRIEGPVQFRVESENVPITMIPDAELALGQYDRSGALIVTKESLDALLRDYPEARLRVVTVPSTCEQRMQAAMTAMDPYVISGLTVREGDPQFEDKVWDGWMIYKQWADVKRDCWR